MRDPGWIWRGHTKWPAASASRQESVEHAVEADPNTPHVAWEAANFFLLQGNPEKALPYFKVVLANEPDMVDATLRMCWRVTGDADLLLNQVLPRSPEIYFSFLQLLIARQEVAAAEKVWTLSSR